jgi:hypothetical protein
LSSIAEDVDGEQRALTEEVIGYEEIRWLEQREALAAMAIALLASLNKSFLDAQKRMLNKTYRIGSKIRLTDAMIQRVLKHLPLKFEQVKVQPNHIARIPRDEGGSFNGRGCRPLTPLRQPPIR